MCIRDSRQLNLEESTLVIFTSDNGGMWKATNNAPLRANKGANYEGGLRVPVIVKWSNRIAAGSVSSEPVISTDFYPTILAATGQPLRPHQHSDGENLLPILTGQGGLKRDALYWHYPHYNQHPESAPASVIRAGDWKLMQNLETGERELYNLAVDLSEQHNLAKRHSAKTEELQKRLDGWRAEVGADPMKSNPEYVGKQ